MTPHTRIPELLAPAGGPESLRAAVLNGADAVYLGIDRLNARRSAENFTSETLADACAFAHLRATKVYLTANVLVLQAEMDDALQVIADAWASGIDAVIVQDLGLLAALRMQLPEVRVHASTQLNAHSTATVRVLGESGVSRVTLAREVSVAEIAGFVRAVPEVEIESFVHGALCMCYSGQCLMSSLIGGRSANRGMCAQPCRLPYELTRGEGRIADTPGAYLLSPKDLAGIAMLPELAVTGVSALKIEGRMKSPEYVALVTGVYRSALDRLAGGADDYAVRDGEFDVLAEAFSRGFSPAYLARERGNSMMSYTRPNNRGVLIGRVTSTSPSRATVALERQLAAEDTVEFWTRQGRFAQAVGPLSTEHGSVHVAQAGTKASITVDRPVYTGDRVFRVQNDALLNAARRSFSGDDGTCDVRVAVRVVVGEPLSVHVRDQAGHVGSAEGDVVERARTKAVTADEIAEHVGRLGGTRYAATGWDIELSPDAGVGFSALHRVRRHAIEALERDILRPWADRVGRPVKAPELPKRIRHGSGVAALRLVAAADSLEVAAAALAQGADEVHVPAWALRDPEIPAGVVPVLPRISHDAEFGAQLAVARSAGCAVASTLGALGEAGRGGIDVAAHWSLNAANPWTVAALAALGASQVWLSPELSGAQIHDIAVSSDVSVGIAVWGRQEVMVTEHCVLMAERDCDRACTACERRQTKSALKDRKGYLFPVKTDPTGRTHIYNSVPLDLVRILPEILTSGVSAVRIDLDTEEVDSAAAAVSHLRRAIDAVVAGGDTLAQRPGETTTGHYFRGVR